jgi:hypothetical protein
LGLKPWCILEYSSGLQDLLKTVASIWVKNIIGWSGTVSQMVECLPSKHGTVSSNPNTEKKKNTKRLSLEFWYRLYCKYRLLLVVYSVSSCGSSSLSQKRSSHSGSGPCTWGIKSCPPYLISTGSIGSYWTRHSPPLLWQECMKSSMSSHVSNRVHLKQQGTVSSVADAFWGLHVS